MLTTVALKDNPKVYWLWNHRRWCLENIPDGPLIDGQPSRQWVTSSWDKELSVVEKMLNTDPRNCQPCLILLVNLSNIRNSKKVHAWNYRRYVLASMPVQRPDTAELAYTGRKISASFSNFSAWHQRSKIYSSLWNSGQLDSIKAREQGSDLYWYFFSYSPVEEFELVHNAIYTDPEDQSAWIYHRWLIGTGLMFSYTQLIMRPNPICRG